MAARLPESGMNLFSRNTTTPEALVSLQHEMNVLADEVAAIKHNIAYIVFSPAGLVLDVNEIFAHVTGYSTTELKRETSPDFLRPAFQPNGRIPAILARFGSWQTSERHFYPLR